MKKFRKEDHLWKFSRWGRVSDLIDRIHKHCRPREYEMNAIARTLFMLELQNLVDEMSHQGVKTISEAIRKSDEPQEIKDILLEMVREE